MTFFVIARTIVNNGMLAIARKVAIDAKVAIATKMVFYKKHLFHISDCWLVKKGGTPLNCWFHPKKIVLNYEINLKMISMIRLLMVAQSKQNCDFFSFF